MALRRDRLVRRVIGPGRAVLVAAAIAALLSGCFYQLPPDLGDTGPYKVVEAFRVPLPVDPGADARWQSVVPEWGVLGEGRRLARVDSDGKVLWSQELPGEFAITAPAGAPHSLVPAGEHGLMVLAGSPEAAGPAAVRWIDAETGQTRWERRFPRARPGEATNQVIFASNNDQISVAAHCTPARCELTGMDVLGKTLWTVRMNERVRLADGVASVGFLTPASYRSRRQDSSRPCPCLYLVGKARLYQLDPLTGKRVWVARLDSAGVGHVFGTTYRTVVVSAPRGPACTATATGLASDRRVWSLRFRWEQPTAARQPDGCRYDPALPLMFGLDLVFPDAGGALVVDDYDGRVRHRLDRGESAEAGGGLLTWTPGIGYREERWSPRTTEVIQAVRERSLVTLAGSGLVFSTERGFGPLTFVRFRGEVAWREASAGHTFMMGFVHGRTRIVYADDTGQLVGLGAVVDDRR
jgi:PQQ-like domain